MARLFISYKREEKAYAYALRHWLMNERGWAAEDIFIDVGHLGTGDEWERRLLEGAEAAEAMIFLASDLSLDLQSFCYRELRNARGTIIATTIRGVAPGDKRLMQAIPPRAQARRVTQLDQEPTRPFAFVSPEDNTNGAVQLNEARVAQLGIVLREIGVAPDSFGWRDESPYPGLHALREGEELCSPGARWRFATACEHSKRCGPRSRRVLW